MEMENQLCSKCEEVNNTDAKYCKKCGEKLTNTPVGSVDRYFQDKENTCAICKKVALLKHIVLRENIGMIVQRQYRTIDGNLCKKCIDDNFWKLTLTTLIFGWWGTISFFITPFYLIGNTYQYIRALTTNNN